MTGTGHLQETETETSSRSQSDVESDSQQGTDVESASGPPVELVEDVQRAFSRLYTALRTRELQTLKRLEAIWKLRPSSCSISERSPFIFDNESILLDEIGKFGTIDFIGLDVDPSILPPEDRISPEDDRAFSYKSLDESLQREAVQRVTSSDHCARCGKAPAFEYSTGASDTTSTSEGKNGEKEDVDERTLVAAVDEESKASQDSVQKVNPTQDWLNQIIYETETEPSQIVDLMEHSAIECS